jgi:pilus assembly protein CpaB
MFMRIFAGKGAVVLALALGGLTAWLAWRYVDQAQHNSKAVETTPIVVAAMPIQARTVLTPEMLRIQQVPVHVADAYAARQASDVVGKVARSPMTTDEPILASKVFLQRAESGLAFMVPEGMRAVSVSFSEVIGTGGMIAPGDHVDVIGVFEAKAPAVAAATGTRPQSTSPDKEAESVSVATMVLQDVQVLAIAQSLEGEDTRPKETLPMPKSKDVKESDVRSEPAPKPAAKTATLAVSPSDALKLVLAEAKGSIRLALRRNDDKTTPHIALVPVDALVAQGR